MSYFYGGVNISDLVVSGSTAVPDYVGFPESNSHTYNSTGFDKPYNFSYIYGSADVSNYATAVNTSYNSGSGSIPIAIPGAPGYNFKHISAYCWGGKGGGGGGGGSGYPIHKGETGGDGGAGGYAAIISYPINGLTVKYSVGGGGDNTNTGDGSGGDAAPKTGGKGDPGSRGDSGGQSYVSVGNTTIIYGNGGEGGSGGNGGTSTTPGGNKASAGDVGNGAYQPGYTGTTSASNGSPTTNYPNQNYGDSGNGGEGGEYNSNGNAGPGSRGNDGNGGYVQIYFSYQA
jgi:hypothetical protein